MKKVVPKLRQEVKVKVDIVTSDDIKIYYTGKFQDFTAGYVTKRVNSPKYMRGNPRASYFTTDEMEQKWS